MTRATLLLLLLSHAAVAQLVTIANAGFEEGGDTPAGWSLTGGAGSWADGALRVAGTGDDQSEWRSAPVTVTPGSVYRLAYRVRAVGQTQGTPISGFPFANEDLGVIATGWRTSRFVFAVPAGVAATESYLRLGQWHADGAIWYDDVELCRAEAVHRRVGDVVLGEGERIDDRHYSFDAPLSGEPGNHSRPLLRHTAGFNTNRWVFGRGSEVVYRHALDGRRQTAASVDITVGWYAGGRLRVDASTDGEAWRAIGALEEQGQLRAEVPATMLPAEAVYIRLSAEARQRVGENSDPGSFQVHGYHFQSDLVGEPVVAQGSTRYLVVREIDQGVTVRIASLGSLKPGASAIELAIDNAIGQAATIAPRVRLRRDGHDEAADAPLRATVPPGQSEVRIPYALLDAGDYEMAVALGGGLGWNADLTFVVPQLYAARYGEALPGDPRLGMWWCRSGWKVSRERPRPTAAGEAVRLSAAGGEGEAAQLVLRPSEPVTGLMATPGDLRGPGGAVLPAAAIEVLRVGYVEVVQPTDSTSAAGSWPDPLPPFAGPIDLEPGYNQPLWVRVTVPRDQAAGVYEGSLRLAHDGGAVDVPLAVEVYGFSLPETMTCETAFGFDAPLAFQYQGVTDPAQRRTVLARYFESFRRHHISPYDPAPLDPFRVTWPTADDWQGGTRDREVRHAGQASLRVSDDSTNGGGGASQGKRLAIVAGGLKLSFSYRTAEPGQAFIVTFNHYDAGGQWMSGRNNDMPITGDGTWQRFERTVTDFPLGAAQVGLTLWPCLWAEDGHTTGTVWYDDLRVSEALGGETLLESGFEPLDPEALRPAIDWTAWDAAMTEGFERYRFTCFNVPMQGMGGGTFHSRVDPSLLGYAEGTPEYAAAFAAYASAVEAHLKEKGWLDRSYVYWFDEPDPKDYDFVMNGFRKLREHAPGIRRMLTEQVEPELVGGPNLWCPVTPEFDGQAAEPRMAAGDQFWWYVCTGPKAPYCTLFIDHPATELRVWLWQTFQRGIRGVLVWQSNYWTSGAAYPQSLQNPYADPMGWVSGYDTPAGTKIGWGNGDGRFLYPPEAAASGNPAAPVLDGPVDSIRWEMLRDGIEDYEYLTMLRNRIADLPAAERARYEALLTVPEAITADMTTFTTDPEPMEVRRSEIARALAGLRQ